MLVTRPRMRRETFDCLVQQGDVTRAQQIFSSIPVEQQTPFLYIAMLNGRDFISSPIEWHLSIWRTGLFHNERGEEALTLVERMSTQPNQFVLTSAFGICARLVNPRTIAFGRKMFEQMPCDYRDDRILITAAINMFAAFADLDKAEELFGSLKKKDLVSYGAMIKAYCTNEQPMQALDLFWQMKRDGMQMNTVVYILAAKACAEMGMIHYARLVAAQIPRQCLNDPILQSALVDMWASGSPAIIRSDLH